MLTRLQRGRDAAVQEDGERQRQHPGGRGAEGYCGCRRERERETNAPNQFMAPRAVEERETNVTCQGKTAENTGTRETTVPEERSAAVRRDGEPLMNAAKRRRQAESETDTEAPRMDAGERPPSPTREDEEEPPPLVEDPAGQEIPIAAITGREGGTHENSESIKRFEEILHEEARGMLTGYLRDGTEYLQ